MPEEIGEERRLAAIMFTDMVGYSALAQRDDQLALTLLEEHRQLLREIFPRFHGSEIKTMGDAFLVEFGSALQAARCAIEIQRALAKRNHDVTHDRRIQLKIGIHIGDVVHRDGDVYGDGVNIASRIEQLAGAGGICVSMDVERQIRNALEARFEKFGSADLKNISLPMDLFRIVLPWETGPSAGNVEIRSEPDGRFPKSETSGRRKVAPIGITVALIAAALLGGWWWMQRPGRSSTTRSAGQALPAADNATAVGSGPAGAPLSITPKSVAVLPFENLSENKENAFFADGVQDEILTDLAKVADLKVVSRTSVSGYRDTRGRNLRKIAEELGVAHVVEGSVQRAGNKVRVNAQLIDARNDAHLWAQTYDRDLADVFAIQSEIAKSIADQLQATLSPKEKAAINTAPTKDVAAFELYLRAQALFADTADQLHAKENFPKIERLLNDAVARDANFLTAWCLLGRAHGTIYWQGLDHTQARLDLANKAVQTALHLQPDSGEAHLALGDYNYHAFRDYDRARNELTIARHTLPNNSEVVEISGYIDRRQGRWEEATRNLERALELDPRNFLILAQLGLTYHAERRYADEIGTYDRALTIVPGDPSTRIIRARVALDWKGDIKPFQSTLAELIAENPKVGPEVDDVDSALCERNPAAASRALANFPPDGIPANGALVPHAYYEGVVAYCQGDRAKAKTAFAAARAEVDKALRKQPDFAPALSLAAIIDAGLGQKDLAIREGRRAGELLPSSKDAVDGAKLIVDLAQIYLWTGEKDLAIAQIKAAVSLPSNLSYGLLKLHPMWDPLRGDPRFEEIVRSLAPRP
ncbi:MAG: FlgO family outer membrane protein [Chthoniobacterales bacterium]